MQPHNIKAILYVGIFLYISGFTLFKKFYDIAQDAENYSEQKRSTTVQTLTIIVAQLIMTGLITEGIWLTNKNSSRISDLDNKMQEIY